MEPNDFSGMRAESPTAHRMLAIDDEIDSLDRVNPKAGRYAAMLIPLLLLLGAVVFFAPSTAEFDVAWLYLIQLVLIIVGVPGVIYGALLFKNRRQRLRLEREMDELISDREVRDHPHGV
jgi:Flp pilus assembly protein TadB